MIALALLKLQDRNEEALEELLEVEVIFLWYKILICRIWSINYMVMVHYRWEKLRRLLEHCF